MRRAGAFVTVAALGFVVQAAALWALTVWTPLPLTAATTIAVLAAVVHNFCWHDRWTWSDRARSAPAVLRLLRFAAATGIASLAGTVTLTTLYTVALGIHVLVGNLLAVWSVGLVNYVLLDRLIYQEAS
jgi:putative flippase GtrA